MNYPLTCQKLDETHRFFTGVLPRELWLDAESFEEWWRLHPDTYHEIMIHGRLVKTPRWQQAYGADYYYTGRVNRALPVPAQFMPLHDWVREKPDHRLNGLLLNWYDGKLGHYIGAHRDSLEGLIEGAPIVTVSFGETRLFRLTCRGKSRRDFMAEHVAVFLMPYETNLVWKHQTPRRKKYQGRRISVTFRGFH